MVCGKLKLEHESNRLAIQELPLLFIFKRREGMKSAPLGTSTSRVEVLSVSPTGIWLYVKGKEYFLPYADFPWFKDARLSEIRKVRLLHGHHLFWGDLDVDLDLDSLEHSDRYPLKYSS